MIRKWIFRLHMVLGIALGLYAVAIGVTGSVLVYREEITAWQHPDLLVPVAEVKATPDQALASIAQAYPGWRALSLTGPDETTGAWMAYLVGKGPAKQVFVDAGTGALRGHFQGGEGWLGWMERMHSNFFSGRTGRLVNGYCGLGCVLLTITGLLLWRPPLSRLKWRALNLHVNVGLASAVFVIVTGVTGAYFTWHQAYVDAAYWLFPSVKPAALAQVVAVGERRSMAEMVDVAKKAVPGTTVFRIDLMGKPMQPLKITMRHASSNEFQLVSHVWVNPYTGEAMRVERLADRTAAERLIGQYSSVHMGLWGGEFGRALWAVLGLSLPVLFGTSFVLWWRKLRQRGLVGLWG